MKQFFAVAPLASRTPTPLNIFGDTVTVKVSSSDTGGLFTLCHSHTPPLSGPPLHRHLEDDEYFYIESGTFAFVLNGERSVHGPGTTLFAPAGSIHQYQNIGSEPGDLLVIVQPAGLDEFFVELDALLRKDGPPDMGEIAALHAKYRMELLGPPMSQQP